MDKSKVHANHSELWYTPPEWMEWVRETIGHEPFDPCPQDWDGTGDDGLLVEWESGFYCNHPGGRGSVREWWPKFIDELGCAGDGIWCGFSSEQPRNMYPSCYELPGWMVLPRTRVGFVWGGPDLYRVPGHKKLLADPCGDPSSVLVRKHGERAKSPANWTFFWSSVEPAEPPVECTIFKTGRV
jgi:hypothetical protein